MAASGQAGLVTVFGGSGFLGRYIVRALARQGCRVRAAERRPDLAGHLQPMGRPGQVHAVQANLRDESSVVRAITGATHVVNAVGILAESGRQRFEALLVEGPRRMARAARTAGATGFVHISALGADKESKARYGRLKAEGEAAVLAEFPGAVVLRPSLVFGPEDKFFNRFAGLAQIAPVMPLIGGRTRFQPVYVGDVAASVLAAVEGRARPGACYELGGPEVLTMRELLERTMEWAGHRRPLLPVPAWLAACKAVLTWPLPQALRPITLDQVRLLGRDNIVSGAAQMDGRTLGGLGISQPQTVEVVVPGYLARFQPKGQFATYRG